MARKTKTSTRMERYAKIREDLKTGDIALFSSPGIISRVIQAGTRNKWSHVGMIVNIDDWDLVLLWESNIEQRIQDVVDADYKVGVQLIALSHKLRTFEGEVAFRHLNKPLGEPELKKLRDFRKNVARNVTYERDLASLVGAAFDGMIEKLTGPNKEDLSSLFCSELVAQAYMEMGLLKKGKKPSSEYTPADFTTSQFASLPLASGWSLGPEISIG